jgi:hypothetical protein
MISSIWPMPQNLKVSKNESSNAVKNTQSTQDSSITNDIDFENFITSKQKFIVESNLDPKIKNDLKVALDDLAEFINQNQLKYKNIQIGFAVDSVENMSELAVIQQHFQEQFIDQSQQQLNYNPKGQIPFPKDHAIGFIVGTFDNDEPF